MRALFVGLAVTCLALGLLFGALNAAPLSIELYLTRLEVSSGVALLAFALVGALLGGLVVLLSVAWPLRRELARIRRQQAAGAAFAP